MNSPKDAIALSATRLHRHRENAALDANALELFARVVAAGSFSRAARQLGLTRAAVSRRVAAMEHITGQTLLARTDVAVAETVRDLATLLDTARREFGVVDIYVANAGIVGQPGLGDDEAAWDQIIDINMRAHIRAAKAVMPEWLERGSGHFVVVASAAGLLTQLGAAPYSVTKHAAVGFAEWLTITYGDNGIGVSCVCPMGVDTPLLRAMSDSADAQARVAGAAVTGAGGVISPDDVAELVVQAIIDGTFLVLPHPEVLAMYRQKAADYDRWIAGMRRYQRSLQ